MERIEYKAIIAAPAMIFFRGVHMDAHETDPSTATDADGNEMQKIFRRRDELEACICRTVSRKRRDRELGTFLRLVLPVTLLLSYAAGFLLRHPRQDLFPAALILLVGTQCISMMLLRDRHLRAEATDERTAFAAIRGEWNALHHRELQLLGADAALIGSANRLKN